MIILPCPHPLHHHKNDPLPSDLSVVQLKRELKEWSLKASREIPPRPFPRTRAIIAP